MSQAKTTRPVIRFTVKGPHYFDVEYQTVEERDEAYEALKHQNWQTAIVFGNSILNLRNIIAATPLVVTK